MPTKLNAVCAKCLERQPDVFSITKTPPLGVLSGPQGTESRNTAETAVFGLGLQGLRLLQKKWKESSRPPSGLQQLHAAQVTFARSWGPWVCGWSRG